jgi:hypothetical protein
MKRMHVANGGDTCMRFASVLDKVSNEMNDKMHKQCKLRGKV